MVLDAPVLVIGATGFVGRHLTPALAAAGLKVRCAARQPGRERSHAPECDWVRLDLEDRDSVAQALAGCQAAVHLAHHVGAAADYPDQEHRDATLLAELARAAGLQRLVYLGAVAPRGQASRHLASRLRTGRVLRASFSGTVELRASMIVGHGSASFRLVEELARQVPAILYPPWMRYRSCPVAIDDVVVAVLVALRATGITTQPLDLPGPDTLSHVGVVQRTAALLGRTLPAWEVRSLDLVALAPALARIAGMDVGLTRELLAGLKSDLVPEAGSTLWRQIPGHRCLSLDAAIHDALLDFGPAPGPSARVRRRLEDLARRTWSQLDP